MKGKQGLPISLCRKSLWEFSLAPHLSSRENKTHLLASREGQIRCCLTPWLAERRHTLKKLSWLVKTYPHVPVSVGTAGRLEYCCIGPWTPNFIEFLSCLTLLCKAVLNTFWHSPNMRVQGWTKQGFCLHLSYCWKVFKEENPKHF